MKTEIKLNASEIQSNSTRVDWAEGLILQLPRNHEGRNSWLLNYGVKQESVELRARHHLPFDGETESAHLRGSGIQQALPEEAIPMDRERHDWVLLQAIDWFGRPILAGTIYRQINADHYHPTINGAQCPSLSVDFYTVKNNPNYFLQILK